MSSEISWRVVFDDDGGSSMKPFCDGKPCAWAPLPGSQAAFLECPLQEVLLAGNRGGGKCLDDDADILTDSGWKKVGEVTVADRLVSVDGTYTRILGVYPQGVRDCYRVTFCDGASVVAGAEHRWSVQDGSRVRGSRWMVKTTKELLSLKGTYYIPLMSGPAPGSAWDGPDPYTLGLILGDGTLTGKHVTVYGHAGDDEIKSHLEMQGFTVKQYRPKCFMAYFLAKRHGGDRWRPVLGRCVGDCKEAPREIVDAEPAARLAFLQGLMDADGSVDAGGRCSFCTVAPGLRDAVVEIVRSLGGKATARWKPKVSMARGGYWHVCVMPCGRFSPFRLSRKVSRLKRMKGTRRKIVSIEAVHPRTTTCFAVEHPSRLFTVGHEHIVTHNTAALLADFGQHVGAGFGVAWKGVLFRRSYPELKDVIDKSQELFPRVWPEAVWNEAKTTWRFPDGEQLMLRHMKDPSDYNKYHGHAYPWIGWEELTLWADPACYLKMFSCCRSTLKGMPRKVRATTNPYGPGFNWVKARWRLPAPPGAMTGPVIRDPSTGTRVAIVSDLRENLPLLHADPEYVNRLRISARNQAELEAWIHGSWDIVAGGMFDDLWLQVRDVAVLPSFRVPASWRIDRSFDWGSSKPFSVGWWAESDGTDLELPGGRRMSTVRGDLFRIREWYGSTGEPNVGLRITAKEIARGIVEREVLWGIADRVHGGIADASIFDEENGNCIADDMREPVEVGGMRRRGVTLDPADKSSGSRKQGWEQVRKRMKALIPMAQGMPREEPGFFVCRECADFLRTVPSLTRDEKDPDDVDTDAEDHVADEVRYRVRAERREVVFSRVRGLV